MPFLIVSSLHETLLSGNLQEIFSRIYLFKTLSSIVINDLVLLKRGTGNGKLSERFEGKQDQ